MAEQNFGNHRQFVPGYHFGAGILLIGVFVWSVRRYIAMPDVDRGLFVALTFGVLVGLSYARSFALKVQDRVIRLEERMRLTQLLPASMQSRIGEFSAAQLVALRFASDSELPDLATRVLNEKIQKRDDIKKLIRDWRPDTHRA